MKKIIILIILFLYSCSNYTTKKNPQDNIIFSKDMTLNEFMLNLEKYGKESTYPDLDNWYEK